MTAADREAAKLFPITEVIRRLRTYRERHFTGPARASDPFQWLLERAVAILECEHDSSDGTGEVVSIAMGEEGVAVFMVFRCCACGRDTISVPTGMGTERTLVVR